MIAGAIVHGYVQLRTVDLCLDADLLVAGAGLVQVGFARVRLDQVGNVGRDRLEVFCDDVDCTVKVVVELGVLEQLAAAIDCRLFLAPRF